MVAKVELQPGTCPGQLGDREEVDAEWEVHKPEVYRKTASAEKRNPRTLLCGTPSETHLHAWKGSLFSCLSLCLCVSGLITIPPT